MSNPTIRIVTSESNLIPAASLPQVQPTSNPGLASTPSTYMGLDEMAIDTPSLTNISNVDSSSSSSSSVEEPKHKKMQRLWAAFKRFVRNPKRTRDEFFIHRNHPFADTMAGGPGNRILVTKEVITTNEAAPLLTPAADHHVSPTTTATPVSPVTAARFQPWDLEEGGKDAAAAAATTTTAAAAAAAPAAKDDGDKKKNKAKWTSAFQEDDEQQQGPGFVKSFSRNFRRSVSAAFPVRYLPARDAQAERVHDSE
ncbi:hypothetical protein F4818DRAFT_441414 [Hypoxylon cercidicola]|nr:hypothetical protein F4818DRAFT_441414 [Hypoxylon cercidicola]